MTSGSQGVALVSAIINVGQSLKLNVVAEGVETPAQLEFLKAAKCDEYQGYHFSRPLPAAEFEQLIRNSDATHDSWTEEDAIRTHSKLAAYVRR